MKKSIFASTLIAATALAVPALAETLTWGGSDGSWTDENAWSGSTWTKDDNAIFSSGTGTVSVTTDVTANSVTIDGASYTFNIDGSATLTTGDLTYDNNGSLAISGSGTVKTGYSSDVAFAIDASEFTGTLEITSGRFDMVNSTLNASATLVFDTTGSSSDYYGDGTVSIHYGNSKGTQEDPASYTVANNIELKGNGGVLLRSYNSYTTITFTGSVTGESAELQLNGGGNAIFQGTVDLGTYITYQGSTTFAGETTLGTLEFSKSGSTVSSITFSNDASVGAITVQSNASAFTDQLTVSSGATLTVGSISLGADTLEVTTTGEGSTFIVTGDITVDGGTLSIGDGSTVTATGTTATATRASLAGISGAGTLEIVDGSETPSSKEFIITTSEDFTGNVYIKSGRLVLVSSSIAEDAKVILQASGEKSGNTYENAVSLTLGGAGVSLTNDITIEGEGAIQIRTGGGSGELSGDITAADAAYIQINGGQTVTLSGDVSLENGGYISYQGTTTFTGKVTLGSLDFVQENEIASAVIFSGESAQATVGTLTADSTNGTLSATLTVSNGASLEVGTLAVSHNLAIAIDNATLSITTSATGTGSTSIVISNGGTLNVGQDVTLNVDAMEIILGVDNMEADTAILTGSGSIPNSVIVLTVDSALDQFFKEQGEGEYTFNLYDTSLSLSSTDIILSAFDEYGYASLNTSTGVLTVYVENIPEPSAFGLMFGLGAIGLVATRRRRRA